MPAKRLQPENPELLAAIITHPDEDTPRLIYADWLQENGDEDRAEFIRLNCKLLRKWKMNVRDPKDPDCVRMEALERQHGEAWLRRMPKLPGVRWWCFWRGFPSIQVSDCTTVLKHAKKIWAAAPVERVDINDLAGAKALAKSPYFGRVRVLGLNWVGRSGLPALRELLGSPKLTNLRNLVAFSCGLGDAGAKVVAESPQLSGLEVAFLDCNEIGDEGAKAIAKSPYLKSLTNLDISRNYFGNRVAKTLRKRFPQCC
jgi:uncharacterized protein (TIGR02996 family)